jgi:hypothetical protein
MTTMLAFDADDVEQRDRSMMLTSLDLELVDDGPKVQQSGLRFTSIDMPAGTITPSDYIQFQTHEAGPVTSSLIDWQPPVWKLVDEVGTAPRMPDLAMVLQEIVDRSAWQAIATGSGARTAYAFDANPAKVQLPNVEYTPAGSNGTASIDDDQTAVKQAPLTNASAAPDPGARQADMTADDDGTASSSPAFATMAMVVSPTIIETRVASGADDVEQRGKSMTLTSSDLELVVDGSRVQQVGLRFASIDIPAGAIITAAYIQFQTREVGSVVTSLQVRGLASDDAAPFTTASNDLTSRLTTSSLVDWQPPAWNLVNEAGDAQRTPDLAMILQEIVGRSGWQAGNDLGFIITGSGTRTAYAFEGNNAKAPLLHIEYSLSGGNAAPVLDLDASASGTNYMTTFTGGGPAVPIADSDVQITDADDTEMESLTVTLTNPQAGDQLIVNSSGLPPGITVDPGSTASNIVLIGTASIADYQTALQQVLFTNTSAAPDPSARQVSVTVNDGIAGSTPAIATVAIATSAPPAMFETRVSSSADDVEQRSSMSFTSSDLELVVDGLKVQQVGLRFSDIDIPAGATITAAYIQFQTRETGSVVTDLQVRGLASDDAAPFTTAPNDLSARPATSSLVNWQPPAWNLVNEAGPAQRTPDLALVLQEIVDRSGWQAGNDMAFIITGSGTRTAYAFDGNPAKAPLLHIEYTAPQTGDILLTQDPALRENVAGALVGTLGVAHPEPGETYIFSVNDSRFDIVGDQLRLKDGIRLDFERTPSLNLNIIATDSGGHSMIDMVTALVLDVPELRFAAFGDYGNNSGTGAVAQLVDNLNVDFIITTGDNLHNGAESIDDQVGRHYSDYIGNYTGAYGPGSTTNRFFPSLGNHDYSDASAGVNASSYLNYFTLPGNERYYDFVAGPVHFFALNSNYQEPDGTVSTSVQAQWLQQGLAASTSPYNIVYFHHPAYSSGGHAEPGMRWPFEEWGATAVLSAHDHIYEHILRDTDGDGTALSYFVSGLGGSGPGAFPNPDPGSVARYSENWGTMLIQASDESITFEFVAVTGGGQGMVIDSYTIDLPAAPPQTAYASEPLPYDPDLTASPMQTTDWLI